MQQKIAKQLEKSGILIAKNQVKIDKSIKEKGSYNVTIKLTSRLQPKIEDTCCFRVTFVEKEKKIVKQVRAKIVTKQALSKNLPANIEAERAVLGALLLNDEHVLQVAEILQSSDFYSISHRLIYQTIVDLHQNSKRIDMVTLQDELTKREQLENVGGVVYLLSLQEDIRAIGLVKQHALIIKEKAVLRDLIGSASEIIEHCYTQSDEGLEAIIDHAEKKNFSYS